MAITATRPHGSTLLKRKKNSRNKNGKLNIMAMQTPQYCIPDEFGSDLCGDKNGGLLTPIDQPVTYDTIPAEGVPVAETPATTPQILPPGATPDPGMFTPTSEAPATYDPPFSYAETDAAGCPLLAKMIVDVKATMMSARMTAEAMDVYNKWLAYAEDRYNSGCKIASTDPELTPIPVTATPAASIPEPYAATPTVDNPPITKTNQVPTVEPATSKPTVDSPEIIKTMAVPSSTPYPMGPGGAGGGGGSRSEAPGAKKRNWFWIVVGATATAGFIFYQKKIAK